jgi:hypothetical protein
MKAATKMFTYVKKLSKPFAFVLIICGCIAALAFAKKIYSNADFGKTFGAKAFAAEHKLQSMHESFVLCADAAGEDISFMQGIVFPEMMRYNTLRDGIEAESLRTLYVQFGQEYANFSIGIFQMKPSFAKEVEAKAKQLLADSIYKNLQLVYDATDDETVRQQRVERLMDEDWQMIYLTAFVCICNKMYAHKTFSSQTEKLQWYATLYNAGFDKSETYIRKKIKENNFYLQESMPEKKFKYAAIASWFYNKKAN